MQGQWQLSIGSAGADQPVNFDWLGGLALASDDAYLLVLDLNNCRVAILSATDGASVCSLTFRKLRERPSQIVVVPTTGEVLVTIPHQVVRVRSCDSTVIGILGTGRGSGPTEFDEPDGLLILEKHVFPAVCSILLMPM